MICNRFKSWMHYLQHQSHISRQLQKCRWFEISGKILFWTNLLNLEFFSVFFYEKREFCQIHRKLIARILLCHSKRKPEKSHWTGTRLKKQVNKIWILIFCPISYAHLLISPCPSPFRLYTQKNHHFHFYLEFPSRIPAIPPCFTKLDAQSS